MSESILTSTKKLLGITEEDKSFDVDIVMHINSVFDDLVQLGVGPDVGFVIAGEGETWDAFLGDDLNLSSVQSYMYFRLRLMFDPPQAGPAIAAMEKQIEKLEWRLSVHMEGETWVPPIVIPTLESEPIW